MPRGGARVGAGRKKKPLAHHILTGGYRPVRHGPLPPGGRAAVLLQMPAPSAQEPDVDRLVDGLKSDGVELVSDMLSTYDGWTPADLRFLRLAGELLDRRAELRTLIASLAPGETELGLRLLHAERRSGSEFLAALKSIGVARDPSS
jgi:hypothetical protein